MHSPFLLLLFSNISIKNDYLLAEGRRHFPGLPSLCPRVCSFVFSGKQHQKFWGEGVEQVIREVGSLGQTGEEKGGMEMPKVQVKGTEVTRKRL